jgi:restriction endonuclease
MIFNSEPHNWKELQNYVGQMFEECGFETEVSKVVDLVRGKKEIDVYTRDTSSEYQPIILVECKFWNKAVNQETIHSFRTVVADFGANLGFIVSKNGFQAGCYEAAEKTNVRLVSLKELEKEYYTKWKQAMAKKYTQFADRLFPYWDPSGGKMPPDGGKINWETQQLLYAAYKPVCSLGPTDFMLHGFIRQYPIKVPILNDELEVISEIKISNDRE